MATGSRPDLTVTEGAGGLQVRNLRKSYKKRPVIRDVSDGSAPGRGGGTFGAERVRQDDLFLFHRRVW